MNKTIDLNEENNEDLNQTNGLEDINDLSVEEVSDNEYKQKSN